MGLCGLVISWTYWPIKVLLHNSYTYKPHSSQCRSIDCLLSNTLSCFRGGNWRQPCTFSIAMQLLFSGSHYAELCNDSFSLLLPSACLSSWYSLLAGNSKRYTKGNISIQPSIFQNIYIFKPHKTVWSFLWEITWYKNCWVFLLWKETLFC